MTGMTGIVVILGFFSSYVENVTVVSGTRLKGAVVKALSQSVKGRRGQGAHGRGDALLRLIETLSMEEVVPAPS